MKGSAPSRPTIETSSGGGPLPVAPLGPGEARRLPGPDLGPPIVGSREVFDAGRTRIVKREPPSGKFVQVLPLRLAKVVYPPSHPWRGRLGVVFGYAIRDKTAVVLVDTGIGPPHPDIDPDYHPIRVDLLALLAEHDIAKSDVHAIINTHLHFDHCGGNRWFQDVPIYVQRAEREAARGEGYTVREWVDFPGARFAEVEGDFHLARGIECLATPGHTPGHQSVLVESSEGSILLAGHAVATPAEWMGGEPPCETSREAIRSVERLRKLSPQRVYFSHHDMPFVRT